MPEATSPKCSRILPTRSSNGGSSQRSHTGTRYSSYGVAAWISVSRAIASVLTSNVRLFALVTNTLAKDKQIEDGWRRFARPISKRPLQIVCLKVA